MISVFRRMASLALFLSLLGCSADSRKEVPILETVRVGRMEWSGGMPVFQLYGSPYEIGYQHGSLMRSQVRASVSNILAFADRQLGIPGLGRLIARRKLDQAWSRMEPFVPDAYLEEMQGLADGARVPLRTLQRVHAIPDLTSVTCASFAAAGSATAGGRLIHVRNLDWAIQSNVQQYAALFVVHPKRGHAFVNIGWLGFIGVISGINEKGLSVAEIGAESADTDLRGVPMPFLQRRVLEETNGLKEAVALVRAGPRTVGINYLFADSKSRQAVVLETNRNRCVEYWMDREPENQFGVRVPGALVRSDWALNPDVRERQLACHGDPSKPGVESPAGSNAYEVRYRGQAVLISRFRGAMNEEVAMAIAAAAAPRSNIQSIVYADPQLWIAVARRKKTAAQSGYRGFDLPELFSGVGGAEKSK